MTSGVIRAQWRRVGPAVVMGPLLAGGLIALAGWAAGSAWPLVQAMTMVSWAAQIFVICVGVCVAVAVTGDPLIELHEATPVGFRVVQIVRACIIAVSGVVGAVVMFAPLHAVRVWPRDEGWISVIVPVGAVLIVAVVAVAASAFAGTVSATTIAVVAAWMFLAMIWDPYVLPLFAQRGLPLIAAAGMLLVAWRRLGDTEANIAKVAAA